MELAAWQKALAESVFPEYKWEIVEAKKKNVYSCIGGKEYCLFRSTTIVSTYTLNTEFLDKPINDH